MDNHKHAGNKSELAEFWNEKSFTGKVADRLAGEM